MYCNKQKAQGLGSGAATYVPDVIFIATLIGYGFIDRVLPEKVLDCEVLRVDGLFEVQKLVDWAFLKRANIGVDQVNDIIDFVQLREPDDLIFGVRKSFGLVLPVVFVEEHRQIESVRVGQVVLAGASLDDHASAAFADRLELGKRHFDVLFLVKQKLRVDLLFLLLLVLSRLF